MESMVIGEGGYGLLLFSAIHKKKCYGTLNFCSHRTIWGWEFQNATPTVFTQCQSNFMSALATMGEYRLLVFLLIGQVLKILCHFEILRWESMRKL